MAGLFNLGRNRLRGRVRATPGDRTVALAVPRAYVADEELGATTIAAAVAKELGARLVAAVDLPASISADADPGPQKPDVRALCQEYQNAVFESDPTLVFEWHLREGGHYDVELTPGFDLTPTLRADARFLERFFHLREALLKEYAAYLPVPPTVGVRGVDEDVSLGDDSHTLFKLRRQRAALGIEHFGVGVSLGLRPALYADTGAEAFRGALVTATARALCTAFAPELGIQPADPLLARQLRSLTPLAVGYTLVVGAAHRATPANVAALHSSDMTRLGVAEGDEVIVQYDGNERHALCAAGALTEAGEVGLPPGLRQDLHLAPGAPVTVGRPHVMGDTARLSGRQRMVVLQIQPGERRARMALGGQGLDRLGLRPGQKVRLLGRDQKSAVEVEVAALSDPSVSAFAARVGDAVTEKLLLSSGDVAQLSGG